MDLNPLHWVWQSLSGLDWLGISGFLVAAGREVYARRVDRPVVICHGEGQPAVDSEGQVRMCVKLENVSARHALNITFGVRTHGVTFVRQHDPSEDDTGARENAIGPNSKTDSLQVWLRGLPADAKDAPDRVYWCRYRSVTGSWWETTNPYRRTGEFRIRRVWWFQRRSRIHREARQRRRLTEKRPTPLQHARALPGRALRRVRRRRRKSPERS